MYSFYILSSLFFIYYIYNSCFKINKKLVFNDKDIKHSFILTDVIKVNNYIIIDYSINNHNFKLIEKSNYYKFPLYKSCDLIKYVYINKIKKVLIFLDGLNELGGVGSDITNKILEYVGPNYDFNISYQNCILKVKDYLNVLKIDYNDQSVLKIYDNFNKEYIYLLDSVLKWVPKLTN